MNWLTLFTTLVVSGAHPLPHNSVPLNPAASDMGLQLVDPSLDWQTATTKYFRIHHTTETAPIAKSLMRFADTIYDHHSAQFRHRASTPIEVVLVNSLDQANGYSTPFPYNTMVLYVTLPDDGASLDAYDTWLPLLFTHELTHTVHIDMAEGVNRFFRSIFGRIVIPNSTQPQWIIEGLAEYNETIGTNAGRGRSAYIDMYFRDAVMRDDLLPIERGLYWNDDYPFGQSPYWYGIRFHQWVAKKYGEKKWFDFAQKNARWFFGLPGFFNFKTASIFGKSFHRLWAEWQAEETAMQKKNLSQYRSEFQGDNLKMPSGKPIYLNGAGTWDVSKNHFYASVTSREERNKFMRWTLKDGKFSEPKMIKEGMVSGRPNFKDGWIYFAKAGSVGRFNKWSDLYAYDIENEKEYRLTKGFRIKDIHVFDNSILAVRSDAFHSSIVQFTLPTIEEVKKDSWKPIDDFKKLSVVYEAEGFDNISYPSISPDRSKVTFSMHREGFGRDIFLLDTNSKNIEALTQDKNLDYFPAFTDDGRGIYFVSERELGSTSTKVFNAYLYQLDSRLVKRLTDSWTGVFWPTQLRGQFVAGQYSDEGFVATSFYRDTTTHSEGAEFVRSSFERQDPPILANAPKTEPALNSKPYSTGKTLLPHFLAPFGFYTEDDSLVGLATGSRDPLGIHQWSMVGYHYVTPNRPGGVLSYVYNGLPQVSLGASAGAQIANYGNILLEAAGNYDTTNNVIPVTVDDYYERIYFGQISAGTKIIDTGWAGGLFASYADRRSLLKKSPNLLDSTADLDARGVPANSDLRRVKLAPEAGQQLTIGTRINWMTPLNMDIDGIGPYQGTGLSLGVDYSPRKITSDFHTLITTLKGTHYLELGRDFQLATNVVGGMQWLDRLYQNTFRLGGSTSNFFRSSRSFILRGLDEGELRGEGLIAGSLEFRFPLLKRMPGFGTAPLWFRNLHGAFFTDAGETFVKDKNKDLSAYDLLTSAFRETHEISHKKITQSVGAELRSDLSISYIPPITFRLGYGHVLYYQGKRVFAQKGRDEISQFYFQAFTSF